VDHGDDDGDGAGLGDGDDVEASSHAKEERWWRWRWFPPSPEFRSGRIWPPSEGIRSFAAATTSDGLGKIRALLFGQDEGVDKKSQARRCPRHLWVGPTRPGTWAAWATPIWPSWLSSLRSSSLCLSPDEKLTQYFSFYYLCSRSSWNIKDKKKEVFCLPEIKYQK
jgi:hypothetical protein